MAATNNGWSMYSDAKSASLEDLVTRHGLLVKRIAHHLMARLPASVQVDDLLQAGMVGLLEAARNYDSSKGASFETYAGIRIRGAMIDDVRRGDWAPRSVHRNSRRVQEAIHRIERRQGHDPSDQQVAAEMGIGINEYHNMLQDSLGSRLFSLDELGWGDDDNEDRIPGPGEGPLDDLTHAAFRDSLAQAISELPERERLVLALYYDEELNLKEIGLVLGVSESRVSQIHSQAAQRLRARLAAWSTSE